jgi:hypothetical protein
MCPDVLRSQAMLVLGLLMAPGGLLAGWAYRKVSCGILANRVSPHPVRHARCVSASMRRRRTDLTGALRST